MVASRELDAIRRRDDSSYFFVFYSTMPAKIIPVKDLEADYLQPFRTLRRPQEHLTRGIFIAEGEKVVRRLLDSPLTILSILVTPEWMKELEPTLSLSHPSLEIYLADKELLESIVGYNLHQGIMALANVPANRSLDELLPGLTPPVLLVALEGLVNAENVGVIVRNCAALGVDAVISGETSSSPYLRRAVRNSMGAIFHMPVIHSANLALTLNELRERHKFSVVAAHPAGTVSIFDCDLRGNTCIVMGNEGNGVSEAILKSGALTVSIPMENDVDSLNVANASAVFLYEARRQRDSEGGNRSRH